MAVPACSARRHQRVSASPTPSWTSPFGFPRSNREEQSGHSVERVSKPKPGPSPARRFGREISLIHTKTPLRSGPFTSSTTPLKSLPTIGLPTPSTNWSRLRFVVMTVSCDRS